METWHFLDDSKAHITRRHHRGAPKAYAGRTALHPSREARAAIVRPHWLAILVCEIGSDGNDASPVFVFELETRRLLRQDLQLIVHAEEGVIR